MPLPHPRVSQLLGLATLMLSSLPTMSFASDQERLIKQARSLIAESALAIELQTEGKLTGRFVRGLLDDAKGQLDSLMDDESSFPILADLKAAESAIDARSAAQLGEIAGRLHELGGQND